MKIWLKNNDILFLLHGNSNIWLAHWGVQEPSMDCLIWQYTSNGSVRGIEGRVDLDYHYGSDIPK